MRKMLNWLTFLDFAFCALIGFLVRLIQDRKKQPRPDWLFQFIASIAISFLAYISYNFYKIDRIPEEFWVMILSWIGAWLITTGDYILKNGILIYLRKLAEDFLAFTKK